MSAFNDEESLVRRTLGFKPKQFHRELNDMVNSTLVSAVATYKKELLAIAVSKGYANITDDVIDDSCQELLERMKAEYEKNMNKLELYALRNIFTLPNPEESPAVLASRNSFDESIVELDNLRSKYMAIQSQHNILKHECDQGEVLLKDMKQAMFNLRVSQQVLDEYNVTPLSSTVTELNAKQLQLDALCTKAMNIANEIEEVTNNAAAAASEGGHTGVLGVDIQTGTAAETGKVTESMR